MTTIVEIGLPSGGAGGIVDQGNPNTPANAWPVEITDGAGNIIGTAASPIRTDDVRPGTSTVTPVAQNTSTVVLAASNANRKGIVIHNNIPNGLLFVKLGPSASSTDFSTILLPMSSWAPPAPTYTGVISGIWSRAGAGTAQVTELT